MDEAASDRDEFSVYWEDSGGRTHKDLELVSAKSAIRMACWLTQSMGARFGFIRRVIITDGYDYTNFEWKYDEGITYPPKQELNHE